MNPVEILLTLAAAHLLAAASPGPNLVIVSRYAASGSRREGLLAVLGVGLATVIWAGVTATGLSQFAAELPAFYAVMQTAGALYLIWFGVKMLRSGWLNRYRSLDAPPEPASARAIVAAGFLVNITNPKTIAYYASMFAVLIPPGAPAWLFAAAALTAIAV